MTALQVTGSNASITGSLTCLSLTATAVAASTASISGSLTSAALNTAAASITGSATVNGNLTVNGSLSAPLNGSQNNPGWTMLPGNILMQFGNFTTSNGSTGNNYVNVSFPRTSSSYHFRELAT